MKINTKISLPFADASSNVYPGAFKRIFIFNILNLCLFLINGRKFSYLIFLSCISEIKFVPKESHFVDTHSGIKVFFINVIICFQYARILGIFHVFVVVDRIDLKKWIF